MKDNNGVSDDEDEDSGSGSDMSEDESKSKSASAAEVDSDKADFEDTSDEPQPSDDDNDNPSSKKLKKSDLSSARPFAQGNTRPRHAEAQTKAFLMKAMADSHIRLVKSLTTAVDIFQAICTKYKCAAFRGDPYFIQHFLMGIKCPIIAVSVQSMPKSWKDGLRVWRGVCKYNPYEELKMSSDTKVREIQGQERYSLAKGTPESQDTKDEYA
ncbi:hypothetical protein F444_19709 [Phytophthora nicotianae P1976]|uniref:Uncharacterized protein n=1 Tax=Phytophthora nicotianae P1976 TaxID=1317066 RepID=A0A080Z6W4_PHYNI|nr:hypothetical protein F444_19709 [Phytophthora nicotianae P1976]